MVDAEVVIDALLKKRQEMALTGPAQHEDFQVSLRGGTWLFTNTGREFDSVRGEAANQAAACWCVEMGLQKSFTASLSAYGELVCLTLCRAWASKMQFLYDVFSLDCNAATCTEELLNDFEEAEEVKTCFASGTPAVQGRIGQIRGIAPRFVRGAAKGA